MVVIQPPPSPFFFFGKMIAIGLNSGKVRLIQFDKLEIAGVRRGVMNSS